MTWCDVASLDQLPTDRGLKVELDGTTVALFRVGDDVYALGDRCSHAEASLSEGDLFDDEIECPRHGAVFDVRTGAAMSLPATQPVPTFEVRIDGDRILVKAGSE